MRKKEVWILKVHITKSMQSYKVKKKKRPESVKIDLKVDIS